MTEDDRQRTLDFVRGVLDEIGAECNGVFYDIIMVPVDGIQKPAVLLKWDATIHPKTIYDPPQAIALENFATGARLRDDTLRKTLRETLEKMIAVDQHATREIVSL